MGLKAKPLGLISEEACTWLGTGRPSCIFQQPLSLPESAQTLAGIAFRAAGKSGNHFPAASKFAGNPFQQGISDSHSLLEFSEICKYIRNKDLLKDPEREATKFPQIFQCLVVVLSKGGLRQLGLPASDMGRGHIGSVFSYRMVPKRSIRVCLLSSPASQPYIASSLSGPISRDIAILSLRYPVSRDTF